MARRYGLVIDLERCIGCHACTIACKVENDIEVDSGIRVETIGGPHPNTPAGVFPQLSMHFLPVPCMNCDQPPCKDVCPNEAIYKRPDGIVLIDENKCDGCQACETACPYGALFYDRDKDVERKCTLCHERLDEGFEPFCALCCSVEAIFWGDIDDPDSDVSHLISQRKAYTLKPERKTGPAVYYCPPMSPKRT